MYVPIWFTRGPMAALGHEKKVAESFEMPGRSYIIFATRLQQYLHQPYISANITA